MKILNRHSPFRLLRCSTRHAPPTLLALRRLPLGSLNRSGAFDSRGIRSGKRNRGLGHLNLLFCEPGTKAERQPRRSKAAREEPTWRESQLAVRRPWGRGRPSLACPCGTEEGKRRRVVSYWLARGLQRRDPGRTQPTTTFMTTPESMRRTKLGILLMYSWYFAHPFAMGMRIHSLHPPASQQRGTGSLARNLSSKERERHTFLLVGQSC